MVTAPYNALPEINLLNQPGYRLINSKYPPIALFDDVADPDEFDDLFALQALTNPRILNELGEINLLPSTEVPFGIPGCSYACAPFVHVNPEGSRFSNGEYGVLYIADTMDTALAEVTYHQQKYWLNVAGLKFDRFVMRSLVCQFDVQPACDATPLERSDPIYLSEDLTVANRLGSELKTAGVAGIRYHSVRKQGGTCWGLFTPKGVRSIQQSVHYEMIWDGSAISRISRIELYGTE